MQVTGIIVLGHRRTEITSPVVEWYAGQLRARGRKNVRVAYHASEPYSDDVIREMNHQGINTVVILPLLVAEGDLSVWLMPKRIGMPDNSCSYTYITGKHVAIRFTTVFGRINALSECLLKRLSECGARSDDGILLVARGSRLSMNLSAADKHAWYISNHGYPNIEYCVMCHDGPSVEEASKTLLSKGSQRIVVLPMFLFDGESVRFGIPRAIDSLDLPVPVVYASVLGRDNLLLDDLDRKIPEKW